jgi:hypothetical protein
VPEALEPDVDVNDADTVIVAEVAVAVTVPVVVPDAAVDTPLLQPTEAKPSTTHKSTKTCLYNDLIMTNLNEE